MPLDDQKERIKALDIAVGQIEKQFGKGSIMRLGRRLHRPVDHLDRRDQHRLRPRHRRHARGRVVEIYGPESSGKTHAGAAGDRGGAEGWRHGGVRRRRARARRAVRAEARASTSKTCSCRSLTTANRRSRSSRSLIRSGGVDVVVVDSVAALVPKAEIEGEMGDAQMGLQARLMSQALRKLTGVVSKSKTTLIFINQLREEIGVMFGNPETTTGGRALKFYASVRIDIRRIASIKDGDQVIGGRTRVKVVKNKMAPPFREAEFDIMYGEGISREGDLLDLGVEKRIIEKSGAWFAYAGERLGPGPREREAVPQGQSRHPPDHRGPRAQGTGPRCASRRIAAAV